MPKSAREKETRRTCGNGVEGMGRDEDGALGPENARRSSKWTIRQEQNGPGFFASTNEKFISTNGCTLHSSRSGERKKNLDMVTTTITTTFCTGDSFVEIVEGKIDRFGKQRGRLRSYIHQKSENALDSSRNET